MASYDRYYQRAIDAGAPGIKLVHGPTGLGKTTAVARLVRDNPERKFVYIANRKQLIEQTAQDAEEVLPRGAAVILRRDLEVVQRMLQTHAAAFDSLLQDPQFRRFLTSARQKTHLKSLEVGALRQACVQLSSLVASSTTLPPLLSEQADRLARQVLQALRWTLTVARDNNERAASYIALANHPVFGSCFPAMTFRRDPSVRLLLMTLHKAFYGFYDGAQLCNLTRFFADDRLILVLDEFDFLEHDLVQLICRSPQIDDPFDFTANFYRGMAHHKLPKEDYPLEPELRLKVQAITDYIDRAIRAPGLNFPDINQFTLPRSATSGGARQSSPAIFRTLHTVSTGSLFVRQTERAFQLEQGPRGPGLLSARTLFSAVGAATTRILALFKDLERADEVRYWELLRQCFRNTVFLEQVGDIAQFPRRPEPQRTARGGLLESGYQLFDIDDLQQRTDQEEVRVRFYQLSQTPENLLRILAQRFLVFGLSATADITRSVHHFDLAWLEEQGLVLPTLLEDRADIEEMSRDKAARRGNTLSMTLVDGLDPHDPIQAPLRPFLDAVTRDEQFPQDTAGGHRSLRMHRFFAALHAILRSETKTPRALLFLNAFLQVRLLLTAYAAHAAEAGVYEVEPIASHHSWFEALRLTFPTTPTAPVTIVFFDAAAAAELRQRPEAERAFAQLFWDDTPVVVVTQYLSAGNGVNLQYTNAEGGAPCDFTHVGLLEAPYFFFDPPDFEVMSSDQILAAHKANIWYQAKLFYGHHISESRFKQALATLAHPAEWNARYAHGDAARDCLLNKLAIFIQALGRVERVWEPTPSQQALLAPEAFQVFQAFVGPEFEPLREERASFASANLHALLEAVAATSADHEAEARRQRDERLRATNARCREEIGGLVAQLETLRANPLDPAGRQARRAWEELRRATLRHDFHAHVARTYACVSQSPYVVRGRMNLTPELDLLPLGVLHPERHITDANGLYAVIERNAVIQERFARHGYDLRFDHPGPEFFTPYCLQAILAGAIGEEAISALLTHEGFPVEALPDEIFELADLKLAGAPWFIDAKNYSEQTLDRFPLPPEDPLWHPTLSERHFKRHAQAKLARLRASAGPTSKLIYINLVTSQPRPVGYYDARFADARDFGAASIVVIQGAIERGEPNRYHHAFAVFLHDLRRALEEIAGETHAPHADDGIDESIGDPWSAGYLQRDETEEEIR